MKCGQSLTALRVFFNQLVKGILRATGNKNMIPSFEKVVHQYAANCPVPPVIRWFG